MGNHRHTLNGRAGTLLNRESFSPAVFCGGRRWRQADEGGVFAICEISLDGRTSGIIDLSTTPISDFLVDAADRFTIAYNRAASGDENLGITSRAFIRTAEPARRRASKQ
jgi:hypothetical protein